MIRIYTVPARRLQTYHCTTALFAQINTTNPLNVNIAAEVTTPLACMRFIGLPLPIMQFVFFL
jgi:hypothetical protein